MKLKLGRQHWGMKGTGDYGSGNGVFRERGKYWLEGDKRGEHWNWKRRGNWWKRGKGHTLLGLEWTFTEMERKT